MTLASYLNNYRKAKKSDQARYSRAFSQYIVAACWGKMYRRITTWTAVGFIFRLHALIDGFQHKVEESWPDHPESSLGPGDRSLRQLLRDLDQVQVAQKITSFGVPHSSGNLMSAIKGSGPIYTKETAFDFHILVCTTFINYAAALAAAQRDYDALVCLFHRK